MKIIATKRATWESATFITLVQIEEDWFEITDGTDTERFVYSDEYTIKEARQDVLAKFAARGI